MVRSKGADSNQSPHSRADGRRSLLVYLNAELIKELKRAALDDDRNTYEIVEEAARNWLGRRDKKRRSP